MSLNGQDLENDASLEMKYWAYRYRFTGDKTCLSQSWFLRYPV
jgi:hypothetical protein